MIKLNFPEDLWLNYIWNCIPLIFRVTRLNFLKQLLEKNTPKIVHLRELLKCIYNKCVPITDTCNETIKTSENNSHKMLK